MDINSPAYLNNSPNHTPNTKVLPQNDPQNFSPFMDGSYQLSPNVSDTPQFATPINKLTFDNIPITPDISTRVIPNKCLQDQIFSISEDDSNIFTLFNNKIIMDKETPSSSGFLDTKLSFGRAMSSQKFSLESYSHSNPFNENSNQNISKLLDAPLMAPKRKIGPVKNLFPKYTRGTINSNFESDVFQCDSLPDHLPGEEKENKLAVKRIYSVPSYMDEASSSFPKPIMNYKTLNDRLKSTSTMSNDELIGDLSRPHSLPLLSKRLDGLSYISDQTMAEFMDEKYGQLDVLVIDCRYPYEYDGGHIKNAINIYTKDTIMDRFFKDPNLLFKNETHTSPILIFHCEYSSYRAPALARFLRNKDRNIHRSCYPKLYYPEIYVLNGGYKQFFNSYNNYCHPPSYITMDDLKKKKKKIFYNKQSKVDSYDPSASIKVGIGRR